MSRIFGGSQPTTQSVTHTRLKVMRGVSSRSSNNSQFYDYEWCRTLKLWGSHGCFLWSLVASVWTRFIKIRDYSCSVSHNQIQMAWSKSNTIRIDVHFLDFGVFLNAQHHESNDWWEKGVDHFYCSRSICKFSWIFPRFCGIFTNALWRIDTHLAFLSSRSGTSCCFCVVGRRRGGPAAADGRWPQIR